MAVLLMLVAIHSSHLHAGEREWKQYMQQGWEAQARGDHRAAIEAYRRALKESDAFGESDTRFGQTLLLGGRAYQVQGDYAEAETLYHRALPILEKALGSEHQIVVTTLSALGLLYVAQGRIGEGGSLYRRAHESSERTLGPEHPNLAMSLSGLALVSQLQGRYEEAARLRRRVLAINEKAFGPEHAMVAASLFPLGLLYRQQGRYCKLQAQR